MSEAVSSQTILIPGKLSDGQKISEIALLIEANEP